MRLVINKCDLPAAWDQGQAAGAVRVSALTGEGIAELCQALARWLVPDPPPPGAAVPFTADLCDRIDKARRCPHSTGIEEALCSLLSTD
jgi:tRNA modification GTPase